MGFVIHVDTIKKLKQKLIGMKEKTAIDLCNKYRDPDSQYDVLVPGSGGKDSIYVAHLLKYKYNMKPLTVTWAPIFLQI